jgi:hypothetical protein
MLTLIVYQGIDQYGSTTIMRKLDFESKFEEDLSLRKILIEKDAFFSRF